MRHLVLELMMMNSHRVIVSHAASTGVSKGRGRGRPWSCRGRSIVVCSGWVQEVQVIAEGGGGEEGRWRRWLGIFLEVDKTNVWTLHSFTLIVLDHRQGWWLNKVVVIIHTVCRVRRRRKLFLKSYSSIHGHKLNSRNLWWKHESHSHNFYLTSLLLQLKLKTEAAVLEDQQQPSLDLDSEHCLSCTFCCFQEKRRNGKF